MMVQYMVDFGTMDLTMKLDADLRRARPNLHGPGAEVWRIAAGGRRDTERMNSPGTRLRVAVVWVHLPLRDRSRWEKLWRFLFPAVETCWNPLE